MKRTNEKLWEKIKDQVMNKEVMGTKKGQWSARKAQLAVKLYKEAGGGYIGEKDKDNALVKWTKEEWTTKSGKPSHITGERYLPKKAIEALTDEQYKQTTKEKRKAMKEGEQYSKQPSKIALLVKKYR
jgi:hypothetical protein